MMKKLKSPTNKVEMPRNLLSNPIEGLRGQTIQKGLVRSQLSLKKDALKGMIMMESLDLAVLFQEKQLQIKEKRIRDRNETDSKIHFKLNRKNPLLFEVQCESYVNGLRK